MNRADRFCLVHWSATQAQHFILIVKPCSFVAFFFFVQKIPSTHTHNVMTFSRNQLAFDLHFSNICTHMIQIDIENCALLIQPNVNLRGYSMLRSNAWQIVCFIAIRANCIIPLFRTWLEIITQYIAYGVLNSCWMFAMGSSLGESKHFYMPMASQSKWSSRWLATRNHSNCV